MTSFKRMTRGIKLLVEHIFDPISSALAALTTSGLPVAQYEKSLGTFRVNLTFPILNKVNTGTPFYASLATAPFILPPLQDKFGGKISDIANYELIEVSIGQDTKAENGIVNGPKTTAAEPDTATIDYSTGAIVTLDILSHKVDDSNYDSFSNSVFTMSLPDIGMINPFNRMNPHVQSGISILFDHSKSYLVKLTIPEDQCRVSLTVSLKFKSKLTTRDTAGTAQNAPGTMARNFTTVTATVPAGDTTIEADTASGVTTNLNKIDTIIQERLKGGLSEEGYSYPQEQLSDDAAYEVIAVPMFAGYPHCGGGAYPPPVFVKGNEMSPDFMPWSSAGAGNFQTMDRAIVALQYPVVIHHIMLCCNYTGGSGQATTRPTIAATPNLTHSVGVGLLSGYMSDNFHVEQVASATWTPATIGNFLVDRGDYNNSTGTSRSYSWDILQCPITGVGGTGYKAQGKPVYAGTGNSVRGLLNGALNLEGSEQYLDIRWKISDAVDNPITYGAPVTISGYGGHWVYLICKKTLR